MNAKTMLAWIALGWIALAGTAFAQNPGGPAAGPGPGMMGPGMGGDRPGMGMMHHEMMHHGPGSGPGMMEQGARGPGMMARGRALSALNLNDDQRARIARIMEDARRGNWNVLGQLMSERFTLRELYRADKLNVDAVLEQQRKVDELRRQLLKGRLEAHGRIEATLTPEQQKVFRSMASRRLGRG